MIVQNHVVGEATDIYYGVAPEERISLPPPTDVAPSFVPPRASSEVSAIIAEESLAEPVVEAEALDQKKIEPVPTVEQRKFSAPTMEWDATR